MDIQIKMDLVARVASCFGIAWFVVGCIGVAAVFLISVPVAKNSIDTGIIKKLSSQAILWGAVFTLLSFLLK